MGHEAFGVDLDALNQAESGVRDAVGELGSLAGGGGSALAEQGSGLVEGMDGSVVGHEGLAAALEGFAEKWEWGVRFLVDDGVDAADALRDTRAWYQKMDEQAVDALQRGLHSFLGNPTEDVTAWDDKSAGELVTEAAPDYSLGTMQESQARTSQQFEDLTGWDVNGDGAAAGGR